MVFTTVLIFVAAIAVLVVAGSIMVKTLSKIAAFLKMSEYVIGFIILAFATSLPEFFVGISSAINHTPAIILGTVIGSNIANLTIIIGIPVLLSRGIKIHSKKTKKDSLWMVGMMILPLVFMISGSTISRVEGGLLLVAFSLYIYKLFKERKQFTKEFENHISRWAMVGSVFIFIISLVLLYISSTLVVKYGSLLALDLAIPAILVGLFIVAIGTSLPELVAGISAVMHGHHEMSVGNIIGSCIANSTLVLGVSALIFPITATFLLFIISISFMVVVGIIFTTFVERGDTLSWTEGLSLLLLYVLFLIVEFYMKGFIR